VVKRLQQQVRERGSEQLTEEDIQAEIDAVRRKRAASLQGVSGSSTPHRAGGDADGG
jgi:hypothetical protein